MRAGSMLTTGLTDAAAHIAAIDAALTALQLKQRPTVVAGHSMGGALALRWAAEHTDRVNAVVAFGAPLYQDRAEADEHVARMGRMEALLAGDGPIPKAACAWMCRHRRAASWIAAGYRPNLPIPVARSGVKHTWRAYTGSFNGLIRDAGWQAALQALSAADIPVTLVAGAADGVPVSGRAGQLFAPGPTLASGPTRPPGMACPSPIQPGVANWSQRR